MAEDVLGGLLARLMEPVHVQLSNKTVDVAMPEVFRQDRLLELFYVLDGELFAIGRPLNDLKILVVLN